MQLQRPILRRRCQKHRQAGQKFSRGSSYLDQSSEADASLHPGCRSLALRVQVGKKWHWVDDSTQVSMPRLLVAAEAWARQSLLSPYALSQPQSFDGLRAELVRLV